MRRLAWMVPGVLVLGLSMCGPDSDGGDEGDDGGGSSNGGTGEGGTRGGSAGSAGRGGASAGADGEAGAAGDDGTTGGGGTGGASGNGGSSGSSGTGGCETGTADVLILLDRSASMQDPPEEVATTLPKWDLTVPPLVEALATTTAPIRWGLKTFPEGDLNTSACAAGSVTSRIDVPIADDNAEAVRQAILATTPDGASTPTGDAMRQAAAHLMALPSQNPKYILLVTDGEPSCINVSETNPGSEGQEAARPYAIRAVTETLDDGIATFVLGIGTNRETAKNTLDGLAVAGGRPVPEVNPLESLFYLANDADGATDALDSIVASASSCPPPPASLPLPYADDFESRNGADWRFITASGGWSVTDDAGNNVLQLGTAGDSEVSWAIGGDRNWTDVRVEMRVKFVTDGGMLLISPRFMTLDSFAFVEYEPSDQPKLRRRLDGSTVDLITAPSTLTFAVGQWHTVAVTLQGTTATLEIDGNVIGTAMDATPVARGGIGISAENCIVALDDVSVTAP